MATRRKPFEIKDIHRDIAAVLLHHREDTIGPVDIFRELYDNCEHHGWELEMLSINIALYALAKRGFIESVCGDFVATERTSHVFGEVS